MKKLTYNPWYYSIGKTLIKKMKPCKPNDLVHIKDLNGCFTVIEVNVTNFIIMKNRKYIEITWDRFICLKGEGTNVESEIKKELKKFSSLITYSIIQNEMLLKEVKQFIKNIN